MFDGKNGYQNEKQYVSDSFSKKKDTENTSKYDFEVLLNRGFKLSFWIFFLSVLFFVAWLLGHKNEEVTISKGNLFSKVFFFLNPHLFKEVIVGGRIISYLGAAVDISSFIFMSCYISAFVLFVVIFSLCIWLFVVAYSSDVKIFHYISCLGLFPVIGPFLIFWFVLQILIYKYEMKSKGSSRFCKNFVPEIYDDPLLKGIDEKNLASRDITTDFTYAHYVRFFINKRTSFLDKTYSKLSNFLS